MKKLNMLPRIDWSSVKIVIFDVDGTLYDQRKLRMYMLIELLQYYFLHPRQLRDLKILRDFRREREKHAFDTVANIEAAQYNWCALASGVSTEKVYSVVQKWIYKAPLRYIRYCQYPGVSELFENISRRGIKIAVFSDYPAEEKLDALGLHACCIVCSTDRDVDRLKPNSRGLLHISQILRVPVKQCLFIGDRNSHDGECARRAGMPYLILSGRNSKNYPSFTTYYSLNEQLKNY